MARRVKPILLIFAGLTWVACGCTTTLRVAPYFSGTRAGVYYVTDEGSDQHPDDALVTVSITSHPENIGEERYDMKGTVQLGDETFSMTGHESSGEALGYLVPQDRGVFGYVVMHLQGETGVATLCGEVVYGSTSGFNTSYQEPRVDTLHLVRRGLLDWQACYWDEPHDDRVTYYSGRLDRYREQMP